MRERGLGELTVLRYRRVAARFLRGYLAGRGIEAVSELNGAVIGGFLLQESQRVSVGVVKGRVAELRSLLRFLYLSGRIRSPLADSVPPVAGWHDTGLPATVSDVVRRACVRAGIPIVGAHRLRHALASELLARGATLARHGGEDASLTQGTTGWAALGTTGRQHEDGQS